MKRVYVNEEWCLGCHLCEYYCAFAETGKDNMALALKHQVCIHSRQVDTAFCKCTARSSKSHVEFHEIEITCFIFNKINVVKTLEAYCFHQAVKVCHKALKLRPLFFN